MPPRTKKAADTPSAEHAGTINTRQMRQLHALLRDHGITGDKAVHDYLNAALTERGEPPVESRSDLTATTAAHLIAELEEAEVAAAHTTNGAMLTKLRAEFKNDELGHLPRSTCQACSKAQRKVCEQHTWVSQCSVCGGRHSSATMHITYVGHADVTARLLEVDPLWSWRPFTADEIAGVPPAMRNGLWIWLQVGGVERPGFGHAEGDRQTGGDAVKVAIGDALRNAAMRFGVALDLWAKGDREWAKAAKEEGQLNPPMDPAAPVQRQTADQQEWYGPTTAELLLMIDGHAQRAGTTYEAITAKWRADNGNLTLDQLDTQPPQLIAQLESRIAAYLRENPPAASGELTGDRDV